MVISRVRIMLKVEDSLYQEEALKRLQGYNNIVFLHINETDSGVLLRLIKNQITYDCVLVCV